MLFFFILKFKRVKLSRFTMIESIKIVQVVFTFHFDATVRACRWQCRMQTMDLCLRQFKPSVGSTMV